MAASTKDDYDRLFLKFEQKFLIFSGLKIYNMEIYVNQRRIVMKDTLNWLTGSLAGLVETFGIGAEYAKPPFPHKFNKAKNFGKVLPHLPALKYYCIKDMKVDERNELLSWYNANRHREFDLNRELLEYCRNDVAILK